MSGLELLAVGHSTAAVGRLTDLLPAEVAVHHGPELLARGPKAIASLIRAARGAVLADVGASTVRLAGLLAMARRPFVVDTGDLAFALARSVGDRSWADLMGVGLGEQAMLRLASGVVVRGRRHLPRVPGSHKTFIPDVAPAGMGSFEGASARAQLEIPSDAFVVGLVGSIKLAQRSGLYYGWDLVRALALCGHNVHALVIGDGDGVERLVADAAQYEVGARLHLHGRVPPEDLPKLVGSMDVGLSTQTNDDVGSVRTTGKVPMYLQLGTPVIASHVGEAADVLGPLGWTLRYDGRVDDLYPRRLAEALDRWTMKSDLDRRSDRDAAARIAASHYDRLKLSCRYRRFIERMTGVGLQDVSLEAQPRG